jgi:hypothetical protein
MGPSSTDLETYFGDWHAARLHVSFKNCVYDPTQKILSVFLANILTIWRAYGGKSSTLFWGYAIDLF